MSTQPGQPFVGISAMSTSDGWDVTDTSRNALAPWSCSVNRCLAEEIEISAALWVLWLVGRTNYLSLLVVVTEGS